MEENPSPSRVLPHVMVMFVSYPEKGLVRLEMQKLLLCLYLKISWVACHPLIASGLSLRTCF